MFLIHSAGRQVIVTVAAAACFVALHEAIGLDSREAAQRIEQKAMAGAPTPGARLRFTATGYCRGTTTASGIGVRSGIAAADPDLLPVGSIVQVDTLGEKHNGIYTVMDTGPKVHGRHLDLYMWSCDDAIQLGRRQMTITLLRMGWNPKASTPTMIDRLFRQREAVLPPRPVKPAAGPADPVPGL